MDEREAAAHVVIRSPSINTCAFVTLRPEWHMFYRRMVGAYVKCNCGSTLQTTQALRDHWQWGHFDYKETKTMSAKVDGAIVEAITAINGAAQQLYNFSSRGAAVAPGCAREIVTALTEATAKLSAEAGLEGVDIYESPILDDPQTDAPDDKGYADQEGDDDHGIETIDDPGN